MYLQKAIREETSELHRQIVMRPADTFYVTLLNSEMRNKFGTASEYQKRLIQCHYRDLSKLLDFHYDKKLSDRLGVNKLRRHLLDMTWKRHKELMPKLPILLDTLEKQTKSSLERYKEQLKLAEDELLQGGPTRKAKLRTSATTYLFEFINQIFYALDSRFNADVYVPPKAPHIEFDPSLGMADLTDQTVRKQFRWDTPYWDPNLRSGGAQIRKLITEFRDKAENLEMAFDRYELRAIIYGVGAVEQRTKSAEIAEQKYKEQMLPLVHKLFKRLTLIIKTLTKLTADTLHSHYAQNMSPTLLATCYEEEVRQKRGAKDGEKKLKASSPSLAYCVKNYYFGFMKKIINDCKQRCLDEINVTHMIYFPALLRNEHSPFGFFCSKERFLFGEPQSPSDKGEKRKSKRMFSPLLGIKARTSTKASLNHLLGVTDPTPAYSDPEAKIEKEFVPLAVNYFNEIRDRVTRNILLIFQEFAVCPIMYSRSLLTSELQRQLTELTDDEVEELFQVQTYIQGLKKEVSRLESLLQRTEKSREKYEALQPHFFHPEIKTSEQKGQKTEKK